jgi:hypothetical protein
MSNVSGDEQTCGPLTVTPPRRRAQRKTPPASPEKPHVGESSCETGDGTDTMLGAAGAVVSSV